MFYFDTTAVLEFLERAGRELSAAAARAGRPEA
jgi:hypothetical protein